MKWNFDYFQVQNEDEEMGSFIQFPCFLPDLSSLNFRKKCVFGNSVLTSTRKLMLKVIFIYASESSRYTQKMIWFIGV